MEAGARRSASRWRSGNRLAPGFIVTTGGVSPRRIGACGHRSPLSWSFGLLGEALELAVLGVELSLAALFCAPGLGFLGLAHECSPQVLL